MDGILAATQVESATVAPVTDLRAACRGSGSLLRRQPRECLPEMGTDRPHRTDTPATVPPGYFQSELGLAAYEAPTVDTAATIHLFDALGARGELYVTSDASGVVIAIGHDGR